MIKKYLFIILGSVSFILGVIGSFLPLLPTTPFLMLAAYFFTRSSERFERWLKSSRIYQFYAADFQETGKIPPSKKKKILINIYVLMGISIFLAPLWPIKFFLLLLTIFLTYMLMYHIPDGEESDIRKSAMEKDLIEKKEIQSDCSDN